MTVYVVGTDGSETAAKAAERAACSRRPPVHGARRVRVHPSGHDHDPVRLRHVLRLRGSPTPRPSPRSRLRPCGPEVTVTVAVFDGKPAAILLEEAKRVGADLIVVGNRRMQGVQRFSVAVADDVVHHADCDVLVVKTV